VEVIKNKTLLSNGIDYLGNTRTGILLLYLLLLFCVPTQSYGQFVFNDPSIDSKDPISKITKEDSINWIASLKVNHQTIDVNTFSTSQPLKLNVRNNSIHIVLKELIKQEKQSLNYGYFLLNKHGKEIDRVDLGKYTGIYLSALQSGRYQLVPFIKSGKEDILYTKDPLNFWIKQPFYKSWEFILTGILLLPFLVYAIFYYRYAKLKEKLEILKIENRALKQKEALKIKENHALAMNSSHSITNPKKEEIAALLANAYENRDWETFKQSLNKICPIFLKKLNGLHHNLSENEQWLCAYIKLNIGNKEIAELMFVSKRTIESRRYRLKKKLGLDSNIDLKDYISNLA
jgi:DNA-binding CsgD family transcriptional regulator